MTLWFAGLAIGALFGWFWGYAASQRSIVITLPAETEGLSGVGTEPTRTDS